jgi:hypothetical protein
MKQVIYFLVFLFIISCNNKTKTPADIIPENKMVSILVDIHLADATLNILTIRQIKINFNPKDYYYTVFKKHHTNQQTFDRSVKYYSLDIKEYNKIYDEVLRQLSIIEGNLSIKEIKSKPKPKK